MTDYNRLSDPATASKAFWGQDKWRQLRDNQDSFDERIRQLLAQSHQSIIDDFFGTDTGGTASGTDETLYDITGGATFKTMMSASGDHVLRINRTGAGSNLAQVLRVKAERLAFRLNQDMALFCEMRTEDVGGTAPVNLVAGFTANPTDPTNESDCIAFFKGSSAGKWRFRVAKGGVQSETDNIGNRATWQKLRVELVRAGGGATLQVRAYIEGAEISGSPFTTNIPDTTVMRLAWGALSPAAGTDDVRLDRWETRWSEIPVNS